MGMHFAKQRGISTQCFLRLISILELNKIEGLYRRCQMMHKKSSVPTNVHSCGILKRHCQTKQCNQLSKNFLRHLLRQRKMQRLIWILYKCSCRNSLYFSKLITISHMKTGSVATTIIQKRLGLLSTVEGRKKSPLTLHIDKNLNEILCLFRSCHWDIFHVTEVGFHVFQCRVLIKDNVLNLLHRHLRCPVKIIRRQDCRHCAKGKADLNRQFNLFLCLHRCLCPSLLSSSLHTLLVKEVWSESSLFKQCLDSQREGFRVNSGQFRNNRQCRQWVFYV